VASRHDVWQAVRNKDEQAVCERRAIASKKPLQVGLEEVFRIDLHAAAAVHTCTQGLAAHMIPVQATKTLDLLPKVLARSASTSRTKVE
jgi:hypothetical protein